MSKLKPNSEDQLKLTFNNNSCINKGKIKCLAGEKQTQTKKLQLDDVDSKVKAKSNEINNSNKFQYSKAKTAKDNKID